MQGVDADHGDDRPRHPLGSQEGDRPAHRMADEDHALEPQGLGHRLDIAGQAGCTPDLAVLPRFTVPGLIEGDDAVIGGEGAGLMLPVFAVAAPAVQEDEGRVAVAADLADEAQPVAGTDGLLDEGALAPRSGWEPRL